jgi:hypothetical protein
MERQRTAKLIRLSEWQGELYTGITDPFDIVHLYLEYLIKPEQA